MKMKIEKGEAIEEIKDCYGHSIAPGELFLRGSYLKPDLEMFLEKCSV